MHGKRTKWGSYRSSFRQRGGSGHAKVPRTAGGLSQREVDLPGENARANQQGVAARVLRRSSAARRSCRSNSTSDGVSIRGVFEVASFRPGKAIEAEPEALSPPLFELCAMFRSQCQSLGLIGNQLCRIGLSGEYRGSQNLPTLPADEPGQIGQRSTLADEVIDAVVRLAALNRYIQRAPDWPAA